MASAILDQIQTVLTAHPDPLCRQLSEYLPAHAQDFEDIEAGFVSLTSERQDVETLSGFFQSWAQTNNSAMTASGLGNRLSMLIHRDDPIADVESLARSIASLHRIVDEDLAVVGNILHQELFYRMATGFCQDDRWLKREYLHPSADAFKKWKDHNSLNDPDLMIGLLTTLTHEIYTHGEVEFVLPLFVQWAEKHYGMDKAATRRVTSWISVHCGPTEKNHFYHALNAIAHYARSVNVDVSRYDLKEIVGNYMRGKAEVLRSITPGKFAEVAG